MNNYIVLNKRKNKKNISNILKNLRLHITLKNKRTTVWENDDMQISIDKSIIRVLIYSSNDLEYYKNLLSEGNTNE